MGYSNDVTMVRVDFFKNSGKWYTTEAVKMEAWDEPIVHDVLKEAINDTFYLPEEGRLRYGGMIAVCLEPYHKNAHPLMLWLPSEGKFEVTPMVWTRRYQVDDLVNIQVCASPEEWEEAVVYLVKTDAIVVKHGMGPRAEMITIEKSSEIRPHYL